MTFHLPTVQPAAARRPPRAAPPGDADATWARTRRDEHRSVAGGCPRCGLPWPCPAAVDARERIMENR